ncbi:MAG: ribosome biogenesis GTP-binding protein YihA/YsxC [Lachnospiraceae bacterium]|jgi:GTP-binding protein|nr:ribosome biogenesis GTP-binding protein YihA/YsxC [Lachnospiraceae bacterium]
MFTIKSAELDIVCGPTSKLPVHNLPEFAFAGKSNVGKSTLINGLMNRKSLARTSSSPGKTQTINYYKINGQIYLVDLPGYGYTKASVEAKAKWGKMVENYLQKSRQLVAIFLLIDIRHPPGDNDKRMYEWISARESLAPIIIATKADKIKRSQLMKHQQIIRAGLNLPAAVPIIPYSAQTKQGREEIYELLKTP